MVQAYANKGWQIWALVNLTDGAWHLQLVKRLSHADPRLEGAEESAAAITAVLPMPLCVFTGDGEGRVVSTT